MKDDSKRPIVVVRKKVAHAAHHGGSWKVAYADFVTAMMAFFLVMWIMGMDSKTKDLIQGYFNNPIGFKKAYSAGSNPLSMGNSPRNTDIRRLALVTHEYQQKKFEEIRDKLRSGLQHDTTLRGMSGQVEIVVTKEGLRIELLDDGRGDTFFDRGSAQMKPNTHRLLRLVAAEVAPIANDVVIEGHTDASLYGNQSYSNWELSTDRANAARRSLVEGGLEPDRIGEVRGYADRDLRLPSAPLAASNRRVSILLPFKEAPRVREFDGGKGPFRPAAQQLAP